eukprot:scaffold181341_cov25-Tisochrysis_lutea.AAC.2
MNPGNDRSRATRAVRIRATGQQRTQEVVGDLLVILSEPELQTISAAAAVGLVNHPSSANLIPRIDSLANHTENKVEPVLVLRDTQAFVGCPGQQE